MLAEAVGEEVLGCIPDTSGRYLIRDRAYLLQVEKEDCIIQRKNWKKVGQASQKEEVQKALDEYYDEADTVHKSQNTAMEAIEELGDIIDDHDTIVQILKHVQNPCIQVTATMEKYAYIPCYPQGGRGSGSTQQFHRSDGRTGNEAQRLHGEVVASDANRHNSKCDINRNE